MLVPLLLASTTQAFIYAGNPNLGFRVDRPADDFLGGTVLLDKVRVHHCGGGWTDYPVNEVIDPVVHHTITIAAGDHCRVTWYWGSPMDIDGEGAAGPFTVRYTSTTTSAVLSAEIAPVPLAPYSVVSGSMSTGAPWLLMSID